jgi:hypothetical protein
MKELKLLTKMVKIADIEKEVTSSEFLQAALDGNQKNMKGLSRIGRVVKLMERIQKAEEEKAEVLMLEDQDFQILYESVDELEWRPIALRFPEFFEAMEQAKQQKQG